MSANSRGGALPGGALGMPGRAGGAFANAAELPRNAVECAIGRGRVSAPPVFGAGGHFIAQDLAALPCGSGNGPGANPRSAPDGLSLVRGALISKGGIMNWVIRVPIVMVVGSQRSVKIANGVVMIAHWTDLSS
jgi:hypothetical protein